MEASDSRRRRFEELFERHHGHIAAYARRRADASHVEDIVEETFLVAWRRLERVPEPALPWLYGVAWRVLAHQRRGERRRRAAMARLAGERRPADDAGIAAEVSEPLRGALLALGEREREAVLLIAWEGLSPREAAIAAGCSSGAFRARLHRARRHLARSLRSGEANLLLAREEAL
ncbi:MAG TPA: sigma-70 family RNA polymerase sigma factor [Solirubrobacteraceae bacterium]|jgi:RNA polymerase sigma-70 factor (ECF subfamily)|nr:sigma-70 family RNA polymerase sigma factor [Solirubrobacteraceae bacterium]